MSCTGVQDRSERRERNNHLSKKERYGISRPLVVFVDRFENWVFHAESGERNFGWLF